MSSETTRDIPMLFLVSWEDQIIDENSRGVSAQLSGEIRFCAPFSTDAIAECRRAGFLPQGLSDDKVVVFKAMIPASMTVMSNAQGQQASKLVTGLMDKIKDNPSNS